jgi:hypothetical protein
MGVDKSPITLALDRSDNCIKGLSFFYSSIWARALYEPDYYQRLYFSAIEGGNLLSLTHMTDLKSSLRY